MNKKLVAVAVASAVAAPMAASADSSLTIYGGTGVAIEAIDNDVTDALAVNSNHSAIGFEGSTDVNSSLAAVFHWDAFVSLDAPGGAGVAGGLIGGGRDGWAGVRGSFGTVALGFQGRPWKTLSHALDPFEGTIADYSSVLGRVGQALDEDGDPVGGDGFDTGIGNSIIWFGPNINGFTWHIQYGAEEREDGPNNFGLQGNYSNDQFLVGLSFDQNEGTGDAEDETAIKLVGSVNFGSAFTLTGAFESLTDAGGVDGFDRDAFWLAGTLNVGSGSIRAAVTIADDNDLVDDSSGSQFSVGYFGNLTENSHWYAIFSAISNDDNSNYGFRSDPSTSNFDSSLTGVADNDSTAIAVGIKYNFAADLI